MTHTKWEDAMHRCDCGTKAINDVVLKTHIRECDKKVNFNIEFRPQVDTTISPGLWCYELGEKRER